MLEEYVLDHVKSLMKLLRDVNVTIRWVILHKTTRNRQIYEILDKGFTGEDIVDLILKTSKFEQIFKTMLQNLVQEKLNIWEADKGNSYAYILEISEYFMGQRNWNKTPVVDENYANWFRQMAENINALDIKTSTKTGRKI